MFTKIHTQASVIWHLNHFGCNGIQDVHQDNLFKRSGSENGFSEEEVFSFSKTSWGIKTDGSQNGKFLFWTQWCDSRELIRTIIRMNRKFEWFGLIGLTRYKNRAFNCEWFARIDSRESRCEPPMPLRFWKLGIVVQQTWGLPPPLGRGARPNQKKGAPDTENPLCIGFRVLRGGLSWDHGLRPWSRKGARPWNRGRSEFAPVYFGTRKGVSKWMGIKGHVFWVLKNWHFCTRLFWYPLNGLRSSNSCRTFRKFSISSVRGSGERGAGARAGGRGVGFLLKTKGGGFHSRRGWEGCTGDGRVSAGLEEG